MLRLSKLSDYAIVLMTRLAGQEAYSDTARGLAAETKIPWPTVVKLLKILTAQGMLRSVQGRNGGYRFSRTPSEISIAEIIEAVEGPIAVTECNREVSECGIQDSCLVSRHWAVINGVIRQTLTDISLADMCGPTFPVTEASRPLHVGTRCGPSRLP